MALYHKWDVKNAFAFVLEFFSLISDGLGGVQLFFSYFFFSLLEVFALLELCPKIANVGRLWTMGFSVPNFGTQNHLYPMPNRIISLLKLEKQSLNLIIILQI